MLDIVTVIFLINGVIYAFLYTLYTDIVRYNKYVAQHKMNFYQNGDNLMSLITFFRSILYYYVFGWYLYKSIDIYICKILLTYILTTYNYDLLTKIIIIF